MAGAMSGAVGCVCLVIETITYTLKVKRVR